MKKFLALFALISYVMAGKLEECFDACLKQPTFRLLDCKSYCIIQYDLD